jgi:His/Glu/Gln/Arg/opine family amino acid ABC transporter permease subunit
VDAVVGDAPTLRYFIARASSGLRTVGALLTEEHYGIVMRPRDRELRDAVNVALGRLRADGRFAKLEERVVREGRRPPEEAPAREPVGADPPNAGIGLAVTLQLTFLALLIGVPCGLAIALARGVRLRPVGWFFGGYVELFRGTPLLVQIIFIYYALPQLIGLNLPAFTAAVVALSLNSAPTSRRSSARGSSPLTRGRWRRPARSACRRAGDALRGAAAGIPAGPAAAYQ